MFFINNKLNIVPQATPAEVETKEQRISVQKITGPIDSLQVFPSGRIVTKQQKLFTVWDTAEEKPLFDIDEALEIYELKSGNFLIFTHCAITVEKQYIIAYVQSKNKVTFGKTTEVDFSNLNLEPIAKACTTYLAEYPVLKNKNDKIVSIDPSRDFLFRAITKKLITFSNVAFTLARPAEYLYQKIGMRCYQLDEQRFAVIKTNGFKYIHLYCQKYDNEIVQLNQFSSEALSSVFTYHNGRIYSSFHHIKRDFFSMQSSIPLKDCFFYPQLKIYHPSENNQIVEKLNLNLFNAPLARGVSLSLRRIQEISDDETVIICEKRTKENVSAINVFRLNLRDDTYKYSEISIAASYHENKTALTIPYLPFEFFIQNKQLILLDTFAAEVYLIGEFNDLTSAEFRFDGSIIVKTTNSFFTLKYPELQNQIPNIPNQVKTTLTDQNLPTVLSNLVNDYLNKDIKFTCYAGTFFGKKLNSTEHSGSLDELKATPRWCRVM